MNCTLTLLSSSVRTSPSLDGGYDRVPPTTAGSATTTAASSRSSPARQATTAACSTTAPATTGTCPSKAPGAVSRWRLELPTWTPQFDYDTISDVVLHLRYTARDGGLALRSKAAAALQARIDAAGAVGSARLLDVRHDFPTEWARFTTPVPSGQPPIAPLTLTLRDEHYPYWASLTAGRVLRSVELFASAGPDDVTVYDAPPTPAGNAARERAPDRPERPRPAQRTARRSAAARDRRADAIHRPHSLTNLWIVLIGALLHKRLPDSKPPGTRPQPIASLVGCIDCGKEPQRPTRYRGNIIGAAG